MLKSFCIKTNNKYIIKYLLKRFENTEFDNIYISNLKFKFYNNVIIHYKGNNIESFYNEVSGILTHAIINYYEDIIIKSIINSNYFYFTDFEQNKIYDICLEYLVSENINDTLSRYNTVFFACYNYIKENKYFILDGFVRFRLLEYVKLLDYIVDLSVNKFVIDKEYNEFIDLLKLYINSKDCTIDIIHLIYNNKESFLLDELKKPINLESSIINTKYLSDITFSSNDYALNTLLSLLPKKIFIHIINRNS